MCSRGARSVGRALLCHCCTKMRRAPLSPFSQVICIYVFDPETFSKSEFDLPKMSASRGRFLIESVTDLRYQLRRRCSRFMPCPGQRLTSRSVELVCRCR